MSRKRAPSARKAPAIAELFDGQNDVNDGAELLSALVRLSTERVLQEALDHEQAKVLGRDRYERRESARGYRHG